jgi:hypothetical protein
MKLAPFGHEDAGTRHRTLRKTLQDSVLCKATDSEQHAKRLTLSSPCRRHRAASPKKKKKRMAPLKAALLGERECDAVPANEALHIFAQGSTTQRPRHTAGAEGGPPSDSADPWLAQGLRQGLRVHRLAPSGFPPATASVLIPANFPRFHCFCFFASPFPQTVNVDIVGIESSSALSPFVTFSLHTTASLLQRALVSQDTTTPKTSKTRL